MLEFERNWDINTQYPIFVKTMHVFEHVYIHNTYIFQQKKSKDIHLHFLFARSSVIVHDLYGISGAITKTKSTGIPFINTLSKSYIRN